MQFFMINCKMVFLYMNFSQSLFQDGLLGVVKRNKIPFPSLKPHLWFCYLEEETWNKMGLVELGL